MMEEPSLIRRERATLNQPQFSAGYAMYSASSYRNALSAILAFLLLLAIHATAAAQQAAVPSKRAPETNLQKRRWTFYRVRQRLRCVTIDSVQTLSASAKCSRQETSDSGRRDARASNQSRKRLPWGLLSRAQTHSIKRVLQVLTTTKRTDPATNPVFFHPGLPRRPPRRSFLKIIAVRHAARRAQRGSLCRSGQIPG